MMHEAEKSDLAIVAVKPANKAGQPDAERVERRAGAEGNAEPATHAPGTGPGKRVTGAGPHTESCKGKEEGTVHRAPPPSSSPECCGRRSMPSGGTLHPEWTD